MEAAGLADRIVFDVSVIRGLAYYTGIVFEAFDAKRELRAIFGGGRYDNLLEDIGGKPATAVGLGFGDVVIAEILAGLGIDTGLADAVDVAVGYMQPEQQNAATRLAAALRKEGRAVDLALSPEKPRQFFSRCGKGNCREAAYIGPDDVTAGTVRVKDLASREQREVPLPH
jgi:histidyl-tRNA synthetase